MSEYKACPFCGEQILAKAIKCKHCQSMLDAASQAPAFPDSAQQAPPPPPAAAANEQPSAPPPPPPARQQEAAPPPPPVSPPPVSTAPAGSAGVPLAPPPTTYAVARSGAAFDYPKAGLGMRILAYILDGIFGSLSMLLLVPVALLTVGPYLWNLYMYEFSYSYDYYNGYSNYITPSPAAWVLFAVALLIGLGWSLFYGLFRDGFGRGQSWGKRICGLMVVRVSDNRPCTMGGSFVRNIFNFIIALVVSWIPFVNFVAGWADPIIAMIHNKGWRVGDMVAKTQVIERKLYQD